MIRYVLTTSPTLVPFSVAIGAYRERYCVGDSNTARAKRLDIGLFEAFISERKHAPYIDEITPEDIRKFIESRKQLGEAAATIQRRIAHVSGFFKDLCQLYRDFRSPCTGVSTLRIEQLTPKRIKEEDLQGMYRAAEQLQDEYRVLRSILWLCLAETCGARVNDLITITIGVTNIKDGIIGPIWRKANHCKTFVLTDSAIELLAEYIPVREELLSRSVFRYTDLPERVKSRYPLFPSVSGRTEADRLFPDQWRYDPKTIYFTIRKLGEKVKIKTHPHQLRHTFAHKLIDETNDVRLTAQAMGHSSLNSTMIYTQRSSDAVRAVVNTFPARRRG